MDCGSFAILPQADIVSNTATEFFFEGRKQSFNWATVVNLMRGWKKSVSISFGLTELPQKLHSTAQGLSSLEKERKIYQQENDIKYRGIDAPLETSLCVEIYVKIWTFLFLQSFSKP